jgi:hypothetical protein
MEPASPHRDLAATHERSSALTERDVDGQLRLGFAEIDDGREVWNMPCW